MDSVYGELNFDVSPHEFRGKTQWGTKSILGSKLAAVKRAVFGAPSPSNIEPLFAAEMNGAILEEFGDAWAGSAIGATFEQTTTASEILQRVIALEAVFYEDFGRQLDSESRDALLCLVKYHPLVGLPSLGADADGIIVATWVKNGDWLTIRFASRYKLEFAVSFMEDGAKRRRWGGSTLVTLFDDCPSARNLLR